MSKDRKHLGILVECEIDGEKPGDLVTIQGYLTGTGGGRYTQVYVDGKYHATTKTSVRLVEAAPNLGEYMKPTDIETEPASRSC